jgi:hypothetical protein
MTRGDTLPWALLKFYWLIRGVLIDGSVVKDDQGAHMHRILAIVQKHSGSGLQRNKNGSCILQETEVQN